MFNTRFSTQADIARASDEAVNEYYERTPKMDKIVTTVRGVMQVASKKSFKTIKQKDFQKYLSVANFKNGEDFFNQVCFVLIFSVSFEVFFN